MRVQSFFSCFWRRGGGGGNPEKTYKVFSNGATTQNYGPGHSNFGVKNGDKYKVFSSGAPTHYYGPATFKYWR